MDERDWQGHVPPQGDGRPGCEDVGAGEAVVARARAAARRRLAVYGGGVLATAAAIGTVVAVTQMSGGGRDPSRTAPVAGPAGASQIPTRATPSTVPRDVPEPRGNTVTAGRPGMTGDDSQDPLRDTEDFRFGLFDIAAEHLDPEKRYLDYATRSLQSSSDGTGGRALGIRLGWKVPGEPGEGMVQIAVSDMTGPDRPQCGEHLEMECRTVLLPNGESVERGGADDGVYDVLYLRDDGVSVHVRVDPLFGNNSLVPVEEMRIAPGEVYRLVQDERIGLPELW